MTRICQSCSMPMDKDAEGGGTEADGTRSGKYCSLCYKDGAFTQPDFTVEEMQDFCIEQLSNKGLPKFMGWIFTRSIPRLERWRNR
ncbi:zinc ribbon domain-containing protein [Cucumibacter marinus]|uniref:zinc ribbon domain-containing protein n=1 Tax=Cucumibacter marinus TaxID=1121252 RepID=UPI0003FD6453|nr:zinc ribbon domain-containing protein [Cucumibacter marinus]